MMDKIRKMIIELEVDNIEFQIYLYPDGRYILYGPIWRPEDIPELCRGKLGFGFAMPRLLHSITELIRLNFKT